MYYSYSSKKCTSCSDNVVGCQGCQEYYDYNYKYNSAVSSGTNSTNSTNSTSNNTVLTFPVIFNCYWCGQGQYYSNYSRSCLSCALVTPNCRNCWYDHYTKKRAVCSECVSGMYYDSNLEQCITCASKSPGCQNCWGWYDFQSNVTNLYCYQCQSGWAKSQNDSNKCVRAMNCEDNCESC